MPTWEDKLKAENLARELKRVQDAKKADLEGSRKCGNCSVDVKANDSFCWNCGNPLEGKWVVPCKGCKRLFQTVKPKEREYCNKCESERRKKGGMPGLFRL